MKKLLFMSSLVALTMISCNSEEKQPKWLSGTYTANCGFGIVTVNLNNDNTIMETVKSEERIGTYTYDKKQLKVKAVLKGVADTITYDVDTAHQCIFYYETGTPLAKRK